MDKTRIVDSVIILSSVGVAVRLGFELANQGVPFIAISATVLSILASGFFLAAKVGDAATVEIFKCDVPGCKSMIRAQHVSDRESQVLRTLATDHGRHGGGA